MSINKRKEWLQDVEKLPLGGKTRLRCPAHCGTDTSAMASHNPQGYSIFCFRCGFKDFQSKGYQSLYQLKKIKELNDMAKAQASSLALPMDVTYDTAEWSSEARFWVWDASIYGSRLRKAGIGFSPGSGRVVLPVYQDDTLVYFQLRNVMPNSTLPKYLNPSVDRSRVLYWQLPDDYNMDKVVLVEDILSAIRVGRFVPTVSLLGTKISPEQAAAISEFKHAYTWLDDDKAGISNAFKVRKTLSLTMETDNIVTERDPKLLSDAEIKGVLEEHLWTHSSQ